MHYFISLVQCAFSVIYLCHTEPPIREPEVPSEEGHSLQYKGTYQVKLLNITCHVSSLSDYSVLRCDSSSQLYPE